MNEKDFLNNLTFIVDSREQSPYEFPDHQVEVSGLKIGDYSIKNLETEISIERKSVNDLVGSISGDRERFELELDRSRSLKYFALVCECSLMELVMGQYRSRMKPKSVIQSLLTFSVRYGIPIFFAESREYGQRITESLLLKYGREYFKKYQLLTTQGGANRE